MTINAKRKQLAALVKFILDEDLDLAIDVMMDFAARGLNGAHKKGAA